MIAEIILKKLNGHLSKEETILFKKWLSENDVNFLTYQRLKELHTKHIPFPKIDDLDPKEAWEIISKTLEKGKQKREKTISYRGFLRYAAIFVGLVGCFFLYTLFQGEKLTHGEPDPMAITLELGNGEIQILSQEGTTNIITSNGDLLGTKKNGIVDYSKNDINEDEIVDLEYNTIHIPKGKTFKIVLSDGTSVHLNAGSSLKYPVKFISGKNRQVFLTGEAFFDVLKNEYSPFIVTSGTMDVRVLGTKFNITSYPEDTQQSTVLVEGSVRLYETGKDYDEDDSTLLSPGHKLDWNTADKTMIVNTVNTELYTSWMSGKLVMKEMNFSNIIQRIERHYNVSITNEYEELNSRIFTATFETESIEEVFETFTLETSFEYEINGDQIRILKKY